jgi:cytochrome P450
MRFPPGPKGLPYLGPIRSLHRGVTDFMLEMASYGDLSYTRIGPSRTYMLNHPELIESLLMDRQREVVKDLTTRSLSVLVGRGLLTSDGEFWRHQRKLAAPPLQPKRITNYTETMVGCALRMLHGFRDDEVRDIHRDIAGLTLEIAGRTLLGVDPRRDAGSIARALDLLSEHYHRQFHSWQGLLPPSIPTPTRLRLRRAVIELDAVVYRIIERCRRNDSEGDHLLARLVRARDEDGQPMSDLQLRDEAVTMLLAGHETTALALTHALHMLARHPEAALRLRAELDELLNGRPPTAADLAELPYLDAVIRETLRLYPPAFALGREASEHFELGGYEIAPGAQLLVSPYVMQRDPRFFRNPAQFRPERWLSGETSALPRFAYFPFGGGPRVCIGSHFATLEAGLLLALLVSHVELRCVPGFRVQIEAAVTLRPRTGLRMLVRRRRRRQALPRSSARPAAEFSTAGTGNGGGLYGGSGAPTDGSTLQPRE